MYQDIQQKCHAAIGAVMACKKNASQEQSLVQILAAEDVSLYAYRLFTYEYINVYINFMSIGQDGP